jgi:hypothetical protein
MDKALYDRGMAMRRKVLGDEYVDRTAPSPILMTSIASSRNC